MSLPETVETQLYLGEAGDFCDHPGVAADLPRLRAAVDVPGRGGWAHLVLHWTGTRWDHCDEPVWSVEDGVTEEEFFAVAAQGLTAANAITGADWRERHRTQLNATLKMLREKLEYEELRVRCLRTKIRSLECLAAAGELHGAPAAVARRLVSGWAGSAADLVATAHILADDPEAGSEPS